MGLVRSQSGVLFGEGPYDSDFLSRAIVGVDFDQADLLDHFHARGDAAEDRVLAVEPLGRRERHEELRSVRVRPRVRHRHNPRARVLQIFMNLILERRPVDRRTATTCQRSRTSSRRRQRQENERETRYFGRPSTIIPVPVGSPPWIMKSWMIRWKMLLL